MLEAAVRGVAVGRAVNVAREMAVARAVGFSVSGPLAVGLVVAARDAVVVNVWGQWLEVAGLNLNG
jgi:hypothetical protein